MRKNLLVAAAIVLALTATGCQGGRKKQSAGEEQVQKVLVKTEPSRKETVARSVEFSSSLNAYLDYFIVPSVASRIEKIYVEVGDKVKKDQLLVDLDKTQLNTYRLQLSNAEANYERMKPVFSEGGIAEQTMDEIEMNISVLKESVNNLETNLSFRSPIDGIVTARYFEDGQLYSMSPNRDQTVGILRVMEMDKLKATVSIPEQYFPDVYMGMPVKVVADIYQEKEFNGKVTRISPAINPTTRSFEVEVTVPNASLTLRPGMFARTTFNMGEVQGVTVLDLAVQKQTGTNDRYVFVVENGRAVRKKVTTGRLVGGRIEILSGLIENENVIVAGMSRLSDGVEVEITR